MTLLRGNAPDRYVLGDCLWLTAELSLKAMAAGHTVPGGHGLGKILDHIQANNRLTSSEFDFVSGALMQISGATSYNEIRYPGCNRWGELDLNEIRELAGSVHQIFLLAETKVSKSNYSK